jgi:hypothetical protein
MNSKLMNLVIKATDSATPSIRKIGKALGGLKKVGSSVGSGLKTAALGAIGIATSVAAFTGAAVAAAADEQKQIARLNSVLKTRGMLTEENSAAIDKQVTKLQDLAFSDDQVRESLITATAFTKKFSDAIRIQNVAADVAAAKGISLEEATALVGKAYQGNTKGLKSLGIQTKKGAKGLEVLTAVSKKYKGAAAAAADTVSGKFARAQISLNNVFEDFGAKFLPIAADGLDFLNKTAIPALSNVLDTVAPIVQNVGKGLADTFGPMIQDNIENFTKPGGVLDSVGKVVGPIFETLAKKVGTFIAALTGPEGLLTAIGDVVGALWGDGKGPLAFAVQAIGAALGGLFDIITGIVGVLATVVRGITDFLNASNAANAYQESLGKNSTFNNPNPNDFFANANFAMTGPLLFAPPAPAPRFSGPTLGTSYGAPEFKVIVGQKSFDATVTDSMDRVVGRTGGRP